MRAGLNQQIQGKRSYSAESSVPHTYFFGVSFYVYGK